MYDQSPLKNDDNPLGVKASWFFEQAREHDRYTSYVIRSTIALGAPLRGYDNWQTLNSKQRKIMKNEYLVPAEKLLLETMKKFNENSKGPNDVHLLYSNGLLFNDETSSTILGDLMLTLGSLTFILIIMWLHTGSVFLACCGLLQVLLSFPVALCLYSVVFQIKLFGVLQVAGIFIILGIGADDIFILTDALKQLKDAHLMERDERFARAFTTSFTTMLTTSITTSFAFGMTAVIKIPTVRYMGVFAMTMVMCNFIMVCTVYLSCLILWDTHVRHCRCGRGGSSTITTTTTTTPPLSLSMCLDPCYQKVVAPFIVTHPKKILGFFFLLSSIFLGFATQFTEPKSPEPANPYWPPEHKTSRRTEIDINALRNSSSDAGIQIRIVFGIDTIDRTGTDPTDDDDLGTTVYVKGFDLTATASQQYMVDVCTKILDDADELAIARKNDGGAPNFQCFMETFKSWREARRQIFPVPTHQFVGAYREFLRRNASKEVRDQVGIVVKEDDIDIRFVNLKATTTMPLISLRPNIQKLEKVWRDYLNTRLPTAPITIGNIVFPVSYHFLLAQVYEQSTSVAWTTVALSMLITLIILIIFTQNWMISFLATFSIGLIVIAVVGFVKMLGWDLNPYIATCITILVGFSVDYTVHMAVAYAEAGTTMFTRKERVIHSVGTMGVSITAGALSTAGASAFLCWAVITFFNSFGIFILTAVCSAYIFAMYFFPSVLACVGPEKEQGKLPTLPASCTRKARTSKSTDYSTRVAGAACFVFVLVVLGLVLGMALGPKRESASKKRERENDAAASAAKSQNTEEKTYMPALSTLKEGWHEMVPGGRTSCSRGSPFSFFFKKGSDTEHVILEFMGGGACWNELTCGLRTGTFSENVEGIRSLWMRGKDVVPNDYTKKAGESSYAFNSGINDPAAPNFKTWSRVYIPYCTGDLHWGDADIEVRFFVFHFFF